LVSPLKQSYIKLVNESYRRKSYLPSYEIKYELGTYYIKRRWDKIKITVIKVDSSWIAEVTKIVIRNDRGGGARKILR